MANELDKFDNEIEAVAEEQVELDEFKASGENSSVADPVVKGSNKRPADKTASFTAPNPGGSSEKSGSEHKGEDLISSKSGKQAPKRKADKAAGEGKVEGGSGSADSVTPGQQGSKGMAPGHGGSVKEDIDAIFGDDLSEDLREKAETVFEAAVSARVSEMNEAYSEAFDSQLAEATEQLKEDMTSKVDEYINYLSEQWMEENRVAIESSLKVEVAESFMSGLKGLIEAHNVILPEDEDADVLTSLEARVQELEANLEEETAEKIKLNNELVESTVQNIFNESVKGLAETQIEKLRALSEGLDYEGTEDFSKKLSTLKESYFDNKPAKTSSVEDSEPVELDEEVKSPAGPIANYAAAISRTVRK